MNILLTNCMETLSPGGVNTVVAELGKGLAQKGHTVTVLQGNPLKRASEEIYKGFRIVRIRSPLEKHLHSLNGKLYFYLKKHFKELDPHVVHLHGHVLVTPEVFYTVRRIDHSIPTVVNFHVDAFSGTLGRRLFWNLYTKIDENVAKTATHIVADSDFEAGYVRSTFNVRNDKLSTIPLGVDPIFHNQNPTKSDKSSGKGAIRLLFVGYLIKRKNVPSVLLTLCELAHRFGIKDTRLTIVGTGPEKGHLLRLAEELGIGGHIAWKESLSTQDLVNEFSEADVFLLLSASEAYGLVVAEALSVGTPCIVADAPGLREFAKEPGCFLVESPPLPQKVAQLVLDIHQNEVKVGPFSNKIRTWAQVVQDYEVVYQNLLGNDSHDV
jgi:glycosyltransferase involved in cell wall biosynthesis